MSTMSRTLTSIILLIMLALMLIAASCQERQQTFGTLQGTVNIGPIWPVERPGENPPVPPQVFEGRKVVIYNKSKTRRLKMIDLTQIAQSSKASYSIQLRPGAYIVDINHIGIDSASGLPKKVEIKPAQTVIVDIDIDTGIR